MVVVVRAAEAVAAAGRVAGPARAPEERAEAVEKAEHQLVLRAGEAAKAAARLVRLEAVEKAEHRLVPRVVEVGETGLVPVSPVPAERQVLPAARARAEASGGQGLGAKQAARSEAVVAEPRLQGARRLALSHPRAERGIAPTQDPSPAMEHRT